MADFSMEESFQQRRHGRRSLQSLEAMLEQDSPVIRDRQVSRTFRRSEAHLNVQKSLKLLDESVSSPATRNARTPGGRQLRHSTYTPKHISSGSKFDVSGQLGPTPRKTPQGNRSNQALFKDSFQASFSMTPSKSMAPLPEEEMTEEITTTNVALLLEEDPGMSASKGVYNEFLQCQKNFSSREQVFSLVQEYETVCRDQVTLLNKLVNRATRQQEKLQKTFNVLHLLKEEEATWMLVNSLFRDRLETGIKEEVKEEDMATDVEVKHRSDENIMNAMFERDHTVRQCQLVVDWLESCAREDSENFAENVKFFSDRAVGWENTLHRLQNRQKGMPMGTERAMVDEIDPDAPLRQNKLLDDLDKEDEDRLLQYMFVCVRAGQLEKAQEVCRECGQSWRAATLEGWRLHHDPNFDSMGEEGQVLPVQGNQYRDIWKAVCWTMSQDPKVNQYEKAIYGSLSGNLRAVLPVCKSWLDYLWAYFRVLVDKHTEEEIRMSTSSGRSLEPMPGEYWEKRIDPKSAFQEIEASEAVRSEAHTWYHTIQKYLILGDTNGLIEVMFEWVRQERHGGAVVPLHLLRFMAHLVLFFRTAEHITNEEHSNAILEAYVEELIKDKQYGLVAHYVSRLPYDAQVFWYARFLEGITDREERQECLDMAEAAGLDIPQITKTVVENIRHRSAVDFSQLQYKEVVDTVTSEEDRKKIEAIDWLVFDQSQRAEAMKQANAVMRTFIAMEKFNAAQEVFDKLPPDSVDVVHKTWQLQTRSTDLPPDYKNAIREYLCIKAYLDGKESFNDWFNLYHHGKPSEPAKSEGGSFTDRVAYEHRMKQFLQEKDKWHHNLIMRTQTTKEHLYNVLLFADGGWMVDQAQDYKEEEDMEDESADPRQEQMEGLRHLVLPGLCFLLHKVLHTCQQYTECLQLADIIASEQHKLYEVFRKDELQHLLHLLRESSLAVLDQNRDPLGYEL